jgi:hypothetical protein
MTESFSAKVTGLYIANEVTDPRGRHNMTSAFWTVFIVSYWRQILTAIAIIWSIGIFAPVNGRQKHDEKSQGVTSSPNVPVEPQTSLTAVMPTEPISVVSGSSLQATGTGGQVPLETGQTPANSPESGLSGTQSPDTSAGAVTNSTGQSDATPNPSPQSTQDHLDR